MLYVCQCEKEMTSPAHSAGREAEFFKGSNQQAFQCMKLFGTSALNMSDLPLIHNL